MGAGIKRLIENQLPTRLRPAALGLEGELVGLLDVSEQFFAQSSCTMGHPLLGSGPLALTSSISLRNERKALFHTGDTLLGWRNGRRVRLRGVWGNLWGFESPPEHHFFLQIDTRQGNRVPSSRPKVLILYFEGTWSHVPALARGNRAGTCLLQDPVFAGSGGASRLHESNSRSPLAQKGPVALAVLIYLR